MNPRRKTKIIAFEGIDNCGKDTLMYKLKHTLKDYKIAFIPSVTTTEVGKLIRIYGRSSNPNREQLVMLYMADFYSKIEMIKDNLFVNDLIFCSRWFSSTMAYCTNDTKQVAIKQLLKDTIRPDLTFYIKITPEEAMKRQGKGFKITDIYSNKTALQDASERYDVIFQDKFFNAFELDGTYTPSMLASEAMSVMLANGIIDSNRKRKEKDE